MLHLFNDICPFLVALLVHAAVRHELTQILLPRTLLRTAQKKNIPGIYLDIELYISPAMHNHQPWQKGRRGACWTDPHHIAVGRSCCPVNSHQTSDKTHPYQDFFFIAARTHGPLKKRVRHDGRVQRTWLPPHCTFQQYSVCYSIDSSIHVLHDGSVCDGRLLTVRALTSLAAWAFSLLRSCSSFSCAACPCSCSTSIFFRARAFRAFSQLRRRLQRPQASRMWGYSTSQQCLPQKTTKTRPSSASPVRSFPRFPMSFENISHRGRSTRRSRAAKTTSKDKAAGHASVATSSDARRRLLCYARSHSDTAWATSSCPSCTHPQKRQATRYLII